MVLYGITLVPLVEELRPAELDIFIPVYAEDAVLNGSDIWSMQIMKLLLEQKKYRWYLSETAKSPFIAYFTTQEAAALWEFEAEGLTLKSVGGRHYLGSHLGIRDELEAWVRPQLEAWSQGVCTLVKIYNWHSQSAYARLGMLLQLE